MYSNFSFFENSACLNLLPSSRISPELRQNQRAPHQKGTEHHGSSPRPVSFPLESVAGIPAVVPQRHDSHAVELLVKKQVVGEFFQIGATPPTCIEMLSLRMLADLKAHFLKFCQEIVAKRITDRVVMLDRGGYVAPDKWVKSWHQSPLSAKTP